MTNQWRGLYQSPPILIPKTQTMDNQRRAGDPVNKPSHYAPEGGVECIDVMMQQFGREAVADFCKLNAFKYLFRMERKADAREDAAKAKWYIERWLKVTEDVRG